MENVKLRVKQGADGQWYPEVKSANVQAVLVGKGYTLKGDAKRGLANAVYAIAEVVHGYPRIAIPDALIGTVGANGGTVRPSTLPTMRAEEVAHATIVAMLDIAVTLELLQIQAARLSPEQKVELKEAAADLRRFLAKQQAAIEELASRSAMDGVAGKSRMTARSEK